MSPSRPAVRPSQPGRLGPGRVPRPAGGLRERRDEQQRAGRGAVDEQVAAAQRRRGVGRDQGQHHVRDRPGQQAHHGRAQERGPDRGGQARPPGPPSLPGPAQRAGQQGGRPGRRDQQADLHQVAEGPRGRGVLGERPGQDRAEPAGRGGGRGGQERRAGPPPARLGQHQPGGERPGAGAHREPLHRPAREQPAWPRSRRPAGPSRRPPRPARPPAPAGTRRCR